MLVTTTYFMFIGNSPDTAVTPHYMMYYFDTNNLDGQAYFGTSSYSYMKFKYQECPDALIPGHCRINSLVYSISKSFLFVGGVETEAGGDIYLVLRHYDWNFVSAYWTVKLNTGKNSATAGNDFHYISRMGYNEFFLFALCDSPAS